jgi:hypothetical protein
VQQRTAEKIYEQGVWQGAVILGGITRLSKSLMRDRIASDERIKILILKFSYGNYEITTAVRGMPWRMIEGFLWIG